MKAIKVLILVSIVFSFIWAGPESFDHLKEYKLKNVEKKGPVKETVFLEGQDESSTAKYIYNKKNQIIKILYFSKNNKPDGYTIIKYGKNGISKEETYSKNGVLVETIYYTTNKSGKIISYKIHDSYYNANILWKFAFNRSRLIGGRRYVNKQVSESFRIKNVSRDKKIQFLYNSVGEKSGSIEYLYQDKKLVSRLKKDLSGYKRVEYSYDKKGRIKEIKFFKSSKKGMKLIKTHKLFYSSSIDTKAGIRM